MAESDDAEPDDHEAGEDNRILMHFEFQGRSSRKPMRLRVLDYVARIVDKERGVRTHSVVFYIGDGVGARDTGYHQVKGIGTRVTLSWHYDVIHLWNIESENLLNLKRPGLLPLIGQTKLENPDRIIPQVYEEIRSIPDRETQHRLMTEFLALLQNEEVVTMVEALIEQDEWELDTPYLRRWRRQVEEAHEARYEARRQDILNQIRLRYDPHVSDYLQLQNRLSTIKQDENFKAIFEAIIRCDDFQQFYTIVEQAAASENITTTTTV